eukprot:g2017.t1
MEPAAARSVPYVFENMNTVLKSSNSLATVLESNDLYHAESSLEAKRTGCSEQRLLTENDELTHNGNSSLSGQVYKISKPGFLPQRKECHWNYPATRDVFVKGESVSTIKTILPYTPLVCSTTGSPISNTIASFKTTLDRFQNGEQCQESKSNTEIEIMRRPAPVSDLGPYFCPGEVGRIQRRYNRQPDPKIFDLSHGLQGKHHMGALLEFLILEQHQVVELRVKNTGIDDLAIETLAKGLFRKGSQITSLDISHNALSQASINALVPVLKSTASSVHLIEATESKLEMLPVHGLLRELVLSGNKIGDSAVPLLCQTLLSSSAELAKLELENCSLGETSTLHLSRLLEGTKSLTKLNLSWNSFGVTGAEAIAEGMKSNKTIQTLDLQWCGFRDEGSSFLAQMLTENTTLQYLDISGNNVSLQTCALLVTTLQCNSTLKELGIRDSPLGVHGARKLLKIVATGNCGYIDLRGCSFLKEHNVDHTTEFSLKNPNGLYSLNLSITSDREVTRQLLDLAEQQGQDKEDGKIYWDIPSQGQLNIQFISQKRPDIDEKLNENQFASLWNKLTSEDTTGASTLDFNIGHSDSNSKTTLKAKSAFCTRSNKVFVTDTWKLELLEVLCWDYYFTCEQASSIVKTFTYARDKVKAATMVFGRIVDPENFSVVTKGLRRVEEELINESIGVLSFFHPENPTGNPNNPLTRSYDLFLGQQAHYTVARRLTELFCNQYENGLCKLPYETPIPYYNLNGKTIHLTHPRDIQLPKEGRLKVFFVDLRSPPIGALPMDKATFLIVLNKLGTLKEGDKMQLHHKASDRSVHKVLSILQRFSSWKESTQQSLLEEVENVNAVVPALRGLSVEYYLSASQLCDILTKIPQKETQIRIEVVCLFWARIINRQRSWQIIIDELSPEEQVLICQRLGIGNVFSADSPAMHYHLDMSRPDEYNVKGPDPAHVYPWCL